MLKYLIILLSDDAVSYCHYSTKEESDSLINPYVLKKMLIWAMKENLSVQFVHSHDTVSNEITTLINSIDHIDIVPSYHANKKLLSEADIVVYDGWDDLKSGIGQTQVIRTALDDLLFNKESIIELLKQSKRINIVFTDVENFDDSEVRGYLAFLESLIPTVIEEYENGHQVQFNLLTDRIMLKEMNNCNAGYESITLAPDGNFYICPAFYLNGAQSIGNIDNGIDIKNPQLYKLDYAPICRECDAFHCKRCIWLNKTICREVNTPSHQQCVMAHVERSISKKLLEEFRKIDSSFMTEIDIPELEYLDPFDKITKQKQ